MSSTDESERAEQLYLDVAEILARRGGQSQASGTDRKSSGILYVHQVIMFLVGGLAAGILARLGEILTDSVRNKLVELRNKKSGDQSLAAVDDAAASLAEVVRILRHSTNDAEWIANEIRTSLAETGYSEQAAQELSEKIAQRITR